MDQEKIWDKLYSSKLKWHFEAIGEYDVKGKRVLELGVGTGKTLRKLIKGNPKSVTAIDISKEAVKIANREIKDDKVKIIVGDVREMEFEEGEFDVIICNYVLNNLLEGDRIRAVSEIKRVLAKEGEIYFEDFAVGDFRQKGNEKKEGKIVEKNTVVKENGLICHFFDEKQINGVFKGMNIDVKTKEFKPFRGMGEKRKIVNAIISS